MQTAAPRGAVAIQLLQYAEAGGALQPPVPFPDPPNSVNSRRQLRQAADVPYADAQLQILSQGNSDTSAMLADLNSSGPSQIFTASGETMHRHTALYALCLLCFTIFCCQLLQTSYLFRLSCLHACISVLYFFLSLNYTLSLLQDWLTYLQFCMHLSFLCAY